MAVSVTHLDRSTTHYDSGLAMSRLVASGGFGSGHSYNLDYAEDLERLYENENPIANVIDLLPDHATQELPKITLENPEEDLAAEIKEVLSHTYPQIRNAWKMARLYGWAALINISDDGKPETPLRPDRMKKWRGYRDVAGGVAGDISIQSYDENPLSENFGKPEYYHVRGLNSAIVHHSRVKLFYGVRSLRVLNTSSDQSLGSSIVRRAIKPFQNWDKAICAISSAIMDFSVDVLEIENLTQLMATQKRFNDVITSMMQAKKMLKVMMLEAGKGSYKTVQRTFTGVDKMLEFLQTALAASADIPATMIFNFSPSGATSGTYEKEYWAQYVAAKQTLDLVPVLSSILSEYLGFKGKETGFELKFNSIIPQSDLDEAKTKNEIWKADQLVINILESLLQNDMISDEQYAQIMGDTLTLHEAIADHVSSRPERKPDPIEPVSDREAPEKTKLEEKP